MNPNSPPPGPRRRQRPPARRRRRRKAGGPRRGHALRPRDDGQAGVHGEPEARRHRAARTTRATCRWWTSTATASRTSSSPISARSCRPTTRAARSRCCWGRRTGSTSSARSSGWPRVADVEAADFNGDGKLDLAVAAFGWRKVGNLSVLENRTTDYTHPSFTSRLIDPRPGAIHAIPVDLNKDGKMDLVVVFAQQFEQVVAFMNNGGPGVSSRRRSSTRDRIPTGDPRASRWWISTATATSTCC